MTCFHPLKGFQVFDPLVAGQVKRASRVVFDAPRLGAEYKCMDVPCGHCLGCRLDQSREWELRMCHEARSHESSVFATLTYDDEHLPPFSSLSPKDHTDFLKRLRRRVEYRGGSKFVFKSIAEYGPDTDRPHYHFCLFGYTPPAPRKWRGSGLKACYVADELSEAWGLGHAEFSNFHPAHARYVARYCTDKLSRRVHDRPVSDLSTGEVVGVRVGEFTRQSTGRGIGAAWYERFGRSDAHALDFCVSADARTVSVPRYYDRLLKRRDVSGLDELKAQRELRAVEAGGADCTPERLAVREHVAAAALAVKAQRRTL